MTRYAVLTGTPQRPRVELEVPAGPAGEILAARLRDTMGLEVDAGARRCVAPAPTMALIRRLREDGIVLDAFDFPETLASLQRPLVVDAGDGQVEVYPRLAGRHGVEFDLGDQARFDPAEGCFRAPRSAVADWPDRLLPQSLRGQDESSPPIGQTDRQSGFDVPRVPRIQNPTTIGEAAQNLAEAADETGLEREVDLLTARYGDVPDWFGMAPYPYQRIGALCVAAGRRLLADAPGLGKSLQAILAATLLGGRRWIIACPPVVQSNWDHELDRCHVPEQLGGTVAVIRPGRKVPDLPDAGIVIVTDSLLAAPTRRGLLDDLQSWGADVLIYDEGHRSRTWETARSKTMRALASSARERIVLTGTPVMSNPSDLAPLLAITGQLEPVFGSRKRFMSRYTRSYTINVGGREIEKTVPRRENLAELSGLLSEQVWVRRGKDQVLGDLPEKAPPRTMIVDVPRADYRAATREVQERIKSYLRGRTRELGQAPSETEVRAWCGDQMGCVSLLRRAAGLAKIPAAADYISDWVEATSHQGAGGEMVYERPLIVWGTHQVVMDTLDAHLAELGIPHAVINGATPMTRRDRIVADYQSGQIAVILANIVAAGVGITLTRGADALFVETEWLPDLVSQAVDRQHRIGQTRTVLATTMVAPGTLDHTIQKVQRANSEVLDAIVGGTGHQVAVPEDQIDSRAVGEIMWELAAPLLRRCEKAVAKRRRAAA